MMVAVRTDNFLLVSLISDLFKVLQLKYKILDLGHPQKIPEMAPRLNKKRSHTCLTTALHLKYAPQNQISQCKPKHSPVPENKDWNEATTYPTLPTAIFKLFQTIVGELRYLKNNTRPDILPTFNKRAEKMKMSTGSHYQLLKWRMHYLQATLHHVILYKTQASTTAKTHPLTAYRNAYFVNERDTISRAGIIHTVWGSPISWCSYKQSTVYKYTCEAE